MDEKLNIYRSLFKGREDVFAIRKERDDKATYMPAYDVDWTAFTDFKAKGGTFKDFAGKSYAALTDSKILGHLAGKEMIGIYPLLKDNTSWFIVADFDQSDAQQNWMDECRKFMHACEEYQLSVYLERSRSGTGGHVWMFFEEPYPAYKSRKIFLHLLQSATSGKDSNFDRLFPNQDYLSGKGFGNLIALPLQKKAVEQGNACFIDAATAKAYTDQWEFLKNIKKVSATKLDELFSSFSSNKNISTHTASNIHTDTAELQIKLCNQVIVSRQGLNATVIKYLRDNLNFVNSEYLVKKNAGKNTWSTEAMFKTLKEKDDSFVLPRGFTGRLLRFCKEQNIFYHFTDERKKHEQVKFKSSIILHEYQQAAVMATQKKDFGIIVAPPGSGKTVMALSIIAQKQQPALIIVHRKQIFDQWIERIQSFLGIPKFRIGRIESRRCEAGHEITIAMMQSLQDLPENCYHAFGTVIVDECHHIPATTFRDTIERFHTYYLYGFTATPFRKSNDEKLIFIYLGDVIHEVAARENEMGKRQLSVTIRETKFFAPFNSATDAPETLMHILIHDTTRNELIVNDIRTEAAAGRKVLVLTERRAHVEILNQYLKAIYETVTLTGDDNEQKRKQKLQQVDEGNFQVLIATGQLFGEGTDIGVPDCLVLAYPFAFEGKLVQYIGRVQRSVNTPVIYDYTDKKIDYLDKQFKQRNRYYRKLLSTGQLKKMDELVLIFEETEFYIGTTLFTIDCLDLPLQVERFLPGIVWKLRVNQYNEEEGILFTEIIDYHYKNRWQGELAQTEFYFYGIEQIKFRTIDTSNFLRSVVLKKHDISVSTHNQSLFELKEQEQRITPNSESDFDKEDKENEEKLEEAAEPTELPASLSHREHTLIKTINVPFTRLKFGTGKVSLTLNIAEAKKELEFDIYNPDIRPEFDAIRDYFSKALKKKLITIDITVTYTYEKVISHSAKSADIDEINHHLIESVRFEFVRNSILKPKAETVSNKTVNTIDDLLHQHKNSTKLFTSDMELFDDILSIKKSKHYQQLKYLSSKHEATLLKIRFVLQPFSFLFLLAGEKKYYIIWETLDSEEATYIWHSDKTRESLYNLVDEIETILTEIKKTGRQDYLNRQHANFSRIMHDYSDVEKGFATWKAMIEERII